MSFTACKPEKDNLTESGLNSEFSFNIENSFAEYLNYSKDIIAKTRTDLEDHRTAKIDSELIITNNAPFLYKRDKQKCASITKPNQEKAILMIHGLSDSPFINRDLANYLNQEKCFNIYTILLTGHGTRPGDLLSVSYKDWIAQVDYAIAEIAKQEEQIYISGFSTGATLALDYVLTNDNYKKIKGLILLSPAISLSKLTALTPFLKYFKKYLNIYTDKNYFKYESFTINATAQIYHLSKTVQQKIKKERNKLSNIKIFSAISYEDKTIAPKNSLNILLNNLNQDPNKHNRFFTLYYQNGTILPRNYYQIKNLKLVNATIAEKNILNISHLAIPINHNNFYYGKNGLYKNCLHYFTQKDVYQNCLTLTNDQINQGEITKDNLKLGIM